MGFLLAISLRSLLLAATAAIALAALRIRSASARHAVWTLVTAGMLAIAIAAATLPDLPLRVLHAAAPLPPVAAVPAAPLPAPPRPFPWIAIYALGLLVSIAHLAYGSLLTRRLLRAAAPIPVFDNVRESTHIAVPLAIARTILLPAEWRAWDADKLDAVLAHERAHIRRADWAIAAAAAVNRCVFWFHPLAWWLAAHLRSLAEQACDDASLTQIDRDTYARTLVDMAAALRGTKQRVAWNALAMAKGAEIRMRIDRILDDTRPIARPFTRARWIALALAAVPLVYFAAVVRPARVRAQQPAARFYVQGEILRPGEYKLTVPTRVLRALVDAGGFLPDAHTSDIVIVREGARLRFNYDEVRRGVHPEQNVQIQPGDIIVVR